MIATFPSRHYDIEDYPAIKNHLLTFGYERLEQSGKKYDGFSARKKTSNKWFEVQDSIAYWEDFDKPKIVWNRIASMKVFGLVKEGIYIQDSMHFFTGGKLELLNIILNSKLYSYLMYLIVGDAAGGNAGNSDNVKKLSIIKLDKDIENELLSLYEENKINQIDRKLYEIYGLNEEEIKTIEFL